MRRLDERGFTLIELIAACAVVIVLLVISLFLLRPEDYSVVRQIAQRRTDIASMVQAINLYQKDNGPLPDVPTKTTAISSASGYYDLCKYLVPKYLKDLPLDPLIGVRANPDGLSSHDKCNTEGLTYAAGYAIYKKKDGTIVLSAPIADDGPIEIAVPKK